MILSRLLRHVSKAGAAAALVTALGAGAADELPAQPTTR
jgi:hypothetical protein